MWCLLDCNNFFVSCERSIDPSLLRLPVVVLSNGDGCIVARSNEVKAMGVSMGMPLFQMKRLEYADKIITRSSQHKLYRKISAKVMNYLSTQVGDVLQYSIDESFFNLAGSATDIEEFCREIVKGIWKHCSIPVSIGIAKTKTLAKIASKQAKLAPELCGVCALSLPEEVEYALKKTDIADVWGVGRRTQPKLRVNGYSTAYDLSCATPSLIEHNYGRNLSDTVKELKGEDCIVLSSHPFQKSISYSRTFTKMLSTYDELEMHIANFAEECAKKLRAQHSVCGEIGVYIRSNTYRTDLQQYANSETRKFNVSCSNSIEIINSALDILSHIYQDGILYKKAGVLLNNISPDNAVQESMFDENRDKREKYNRLARALDSINSSHGKNVVELALIGETEESDDDFPFDVEDGKMSKVAIRFQN